VDDQVATALCVLGLLGVVRAGKPVHLGSGQQRRLLAVLVVHANEVVSSDRLVDLLWGDEPPPTAMHTLQGLVSRLRRTLGDDRLETHPPGYRLRVASSEVDALHFEELVRVGLKSSEQPEVALGVFDDALGRWRGSPYAEFASEEFAAAEVARLVELRARAIEERAGALLELGRPEDVIGELEAQIAVEPFRERPRALLMLALARAGRPVESLRAYDEFRRRLTDEVGVVPSPGLQELNDDIVRQHPNVGWAASPTKDPDTAHLPSGTVSFLFTDVEDSTRLWDESPDVMSHAMPRHDELLRDAVESHDGFIVKNAGDGFHAVFATAHDAVTAAVAAQRGLLADDWNITQTVRVRMGIHTGETEVRDGDHSGGAVNRAQRLMSVAHGGQIVVSAATEELLYGALPEKYGFIDLGEHRLRDLAQRVLVFQVTHPDLWREFPPLQSLDAFPGNLPVQLTSFVGREEEMVGIANALDDWRMVTLTGTGGVGKTRLALQVAAEVLPQFRDGAWLCELAVALDDDTMGQVVAAALGVSQRPGRSLVESIADYLRSKELLLVLDNCEQLLGPVATLAERVLMACPGVRILATSREGLGVGGEHVWPLRPLPVPATTRAVTTAAGDAVVLFVERAEAARATFTFDVSNAGEVAEICRRLDGIPLAIELAAARVVSMSPSEISGLLDERFRLLTGGRRSAVERHQTLRATVDWSYSLLDDRERAVFDRLGVFAGSFDAQAAQAVVVGDGVEAWDVLDALSELVAKSMVVSDEIAAGTTRYQMLETLGQYARERLDEHGDTDRWRGRHAEYFADWAEEAGLGLVGRDELVWRARESAELDNLRAAVIWALERDDQDDVRLALRVVGVLAAESRIDPATGIGAWAERALPHVEITTPPLRYAVTAAAASYQARLGNYEQAQELAERAICDGVPLSAPAPQLAYLTFGLCASVRGDWQQAREIVLDAIRRLDRDFPDSAHGETLHVNAATFSAQAGDSIVARREAESALRQARKSGNPTALAAALMANGWALITDDFPAALAALDESIALSRQGASQQSFATALRLAALIRIRTGDLPHAAWDLREAIEGSHQKGYRLTFDASILTGIEILIRLDHLEQAAVFDGIASTGLTPEYRAGREWAHQQSVIASARAALGSVQYDAAFHTGAQMTYDQAVDHSLRILDDVINETDDTDTA
jgi:predicted ATPase/class 3 adenylate cyclase/DNA-binding winged helix-turn-helix (wHTH) protein